jgi:hypothetical protein
MEGVYMDRSEIIRKASACSTAEELQALAMEHGMDIDLDSAEKLLKDLKKTNTEVSDDELDMVAGGGCGGGGGGGSSGGGGGSNNLRECPNCKKRKGQKWMKVDHKTWYHCTSCNIFFIVMG